MAKNGRRTKADNAKRREEYAMAKRLDTKAEFDSFVQEILPQVRKMLKDGKSAADIAAFSEAYAAARVVTIALTDEDTGKALAAAKDIQDRVTGKAKERTETTHKFEKLKDEELDSLLLSKIAESTGDEDTDTIQ